MRLCKLTSLARSASIWFALLSLVLTMTNGVLHPSNQNHRQRLLQGHSSKGRATGDKTSLLPTPSPLIRHARSIDAEQQQQQQQDTEDNESDDGGIQSNFNSEEEPEMTHKTKPSEMFPSQSVDHTQSSSSSTLPHSFAGEQGMHKWTFRGTGQSPQFPRNVRRDSHFIRFGRTVNFGESNSATNNANKKNNFIRLGRENPRRNNFIRLGRSGSWGHKDRMGTKVGYFPEYYSQPFRGGNSRPWEFDKQQPIHFFPVDVFQG